MSNDGTSTKDFDIQTTELDADVEAVCSIICPKGNEPDPAVTRESASAATVA